jgi:hypothetical protein
MMPICSFRCGELAELAEGARLLSEYRRIASYLGFESPALRQKRKGGSRGFEPGRGKQPGGLFSAERGKREVCAMRSARKGASRRGIPSSPPKSECRLFAKGFEAAFHVV